MRKLVLLISFVLFFSCGNSDKITIDKKEYNKLKGKESIDFGKDLTNPKIVIIDSCEYIQFHTYYYNNVTHKGNCKFCAKRNENRK